MIYQRIYEFYDSDIATLSWDRYLSRSQATLGEQSESWALSTPGSHSFNGLRASLSWAIGREYSWTAKQDVRGAI